MIRLAALKDLNKLVALEEAGFSSDRLSRRSYRYLLTKGHAIIFVDEQNGDIRASSVVLLRRCSSYARLYSLVVAPAYRGQGLAKALFFTLEHALVTQGYQWLGLEVRADNTHAIRLYENLGYIPFGTYTAYYEDNTPAIRMKKDLRYGI